MLMVARFITLLLFFVNVYLGDRTKKSDTQEEIDRNVFYLDLVNLGLIVLWHIEIFMS